MNQTMICVFRGFPHSLDGITTFMSVLEERKSKGIHDLEGQLQAHLGIGINVGLTKGQLEQAFALLESSIGKQQADAARTVLTNLKVTK